MDTYVEQAAARPRIGKRTLIFSKTIPLPHIIWVLFSIEIGRNILAAFEKSKAQIILLSFAI